MTPPAPFATLAILALGTCRMAWRERWPLGLLGLLVAGWLLALLAEPVSLTGSTQASPLLAGFWLRLASLFELALLVILTISRERQQRLLELLLALPYPRSTLFWGRLLGFHLLALAAATLCGLLMLPLLPWPVALAWSITLACELLILTTIALVLTLAIRQPTLAMTTTAGFYLLARALPAIRLMADDPGQGLPAWVGDGLNGALTGLAWLLPDLERFTVSHWLAYGNVTWESLGAMLLETALQVLLWSAIGLVDLARKPM
ncbi:MAG: ABC transporter permease [Magnetococcales bacterium]|nr:ABC transporter permease [Magnetococcales bacterium]